MGIFVARFTDRRAQQRVDADALEVAVLERGRLLQRRASRDRPDPLRREMVVAHSFFDDLQPRIVRRGKGQQS